MGNTTGRGPVHFRRVITGLALAAAMLMTAALGGCGLAAEQAGPAAPAGGPGSVGAGPGNQDSASPAPAAPSTPAPTPTPGEGPACPVLRCTSVLVTGDMLVHAELWQQAQQDAAASGKPGLDFVPLLEGQRRYIRNSDLAICHLETPVAGPEGPFSAYPSFNVPPQIIAATKEVGYRACTTASNHTIDRGTDGLLRTLDQLDAAGLKHTGSYRTERESQGILVMQTAAAKIAVIQATYGLNGLLPEYPWQVDMLDAPAMIAKAEKARALGADIVLAAMHAGDEYASEPNVRQQEVAHALVDSGQFNLVYGHHTHSVLPIENYKGTWIAYGLGNGVTELSPWYVVNNEGLLVRVQFGQDASGRWSATDLAWAPSVIVRAPYRWCSVASDAPQGPCAGPEADAATWQRTAGVVESMGAAAGGAHELLVTREP
ncbi:CapA family protein [Pseudarthrobacter oxydans]|uniref:CapA family protein n=1 Tax=Pseudarthrobacter oxydans TaxID=1671 RepID=UPI0038071792